jgi:hypothetical protein
MAVTGKSPGSAPAVLIALLGLAAARPAAAGTAGTLGLAVPSPSLPLALAAARWAQTAPGPAVDRATGPAAGVPATSDAAAASVDTAAAAEGAGAAAPDAVAEPAAASTASASEEAPPRPGLPAALGGDARAAGRSFALFVTREVWPRHSGQFLYLGGLAGASALLESDKEALRRDVLRSSFYRHSHWAQIGGTLGLTRAGYGAAAAFYLGGLAAGQLEVRRTGMLMAESLLLAQGVAGAVNFAVSEQRPRAGGAIRYFHGGGSSVSIHMTNTMALARVLDHRLARLAPTDSRGRRLAKVLGKVVIYSIPAITGWQRLRSDQHYLWNVVLGAGLSAWVTDALLRAYDRVDP